MSKIQIHIIYGGIIAVLGYLAFSKIVPAAANASGQQFGAGQVSGAEDYLMDQGATALGDLGSISMD